MTTGELIRKYRKMRGMTQAGLAAACGLSDSAVRNYELGNRTPSEAHLGAIAKALGIAREALMEVRLDSAREALEYLFRIDEELGLRPLRGEGGEILLAVDGSAPKAPKLSAALKSWAAQLDKLEAGKIGREEYDEWRAGAV